MSTKTQQTFTQEQVQAMYEALCQIEDIAFTLTAETVLDAMMEHTPFSEFGVLAVIKNVRDILQAIATPANENAAYKQARGITGWQEGDENAAADSLNAGTQESGGAK
jgi:hypothetical protein